MGRSPGLTCGGLLACLVVLSIGIARSRQGWIHAGAGTLWTTGTEALPELGGLIVNSSTGSHGGAECNQSYRDRHGVFHSSGGKVQPPSLLYLGFSRSGSTTLHEYLANHPLLHPGREKEHKYLCSGRGWNSRGLTYEEYTRQFRVPCGIKWTYDLSPLNYAILFESTEPVFPEPMFPRPFIRCHHDNMTQHETIDELMAKLPDVRLFALLRNPLDWHYSMQPTLTHYCLRTKAGIAEIAAKTCYADIFERWIARFPNVTIGFFASEEMFENPSRFFEEMFKWIGVPNLPKQAFETKLAEGRRRSPRTLTDKEYHNFHSHPMARDCKRRLVALSGRQFKWRGDPS